MMDIADLLAPYRVWKHNVGKTLPMGWFRLVKSVCSLAMVISKECNRNVIESRQIQPHFAVK
jgi:hypothetical protein